MKKYFNEKDLLYILEGSKLLGCGGGGKRDINECFLDFVLRVMKENEIKGVEYISVEDIPKAYSASVFFSIGMPKQQDCLTNSHYIKWFWNAISICKQSDTDEFFNLIKNSLMKFYKLILSENSTEHIFPISNETGSIAIFTTIFLSLITGIPIVDGDAGGRAYPSITLSSLVNSELNPSPSILTPISTAPVCVKLYNSEYNEIENTSKNLVSSDWFYVDAFKSYGGLLAFPAIKNDKIQDSLITKTISKCRDIGKTIHKNKYKDPVKAIIDKYDGKILFSGKLSHVEQNIIPGYYSSNITIENNDKKAFIKSLNENFFIWQGDEKHIEEPMAMAPDLICYMTPEGEVLDNLDIIECVSKKEYKDVIIIGFSADEKLKHGECIENYKKLYKKLGYYGEYIPI